MRSNNMDYKSFLRQVKIYEITGIKPDNLLYRFLIDVKENVEYEIPNYYKYNHKLIFRNIGDRSSDAFKGKWFTENFYTMFDESYEKQYGVHANPTERYNFLVDYLIYLEL